MARLLVTGATGFVGGAIAQAAVMEGHDVAVLVRSNGENARLARIDRRAIRLHASLEDTAAVSAIVASFRPDTVIHSAWSGVANTARNDIRQIHDNVEPSCNLVRSAAAAGCQCFIGFGSQGEYGPLDKVINEDELPQPTTLYGAAKVATLYLTRQIADQAGLRFVWLRLFSAYGPGDDGGWLIPSLIREMLAGRRPKVTLGTQKWDWLYIDDVAAAVLAVVSSRAAGTFNLGSGEAIAVRRVIDAIRDHAAPGMDLVYGEVPFRPDQVMHMQADIARIKAATGWKPAVPFDDGIARTIAWHRDRLAMRGAS